MKFLRLTILRIICLPADLIAHLIVLGAHAFWGQRLVFRKGILCTELAKNSWPTRTWYKGWAATTFGHAMMFAPGFLDNKDTVDHEHVHVEQFESECVQAVFVASALWAIGAPGWALGILAANVVLNYLASAITAILRGESSGYRGSHLEEAAYNREKTHEPGK